MAGSLCMCWARAVSQNRRSPSRCVAEKLEQEQVINGFEFGDAKISDKGGAYTMRPLLRSGDLACQRVPIPVGGLRGLLPLRRATSTGRPSCRKPLTRPHLRPWVQKEKQLN